MLREFLKQFQLKTVNVEFLKLLNRNASINKSIFTWGYLSFEKMKYSITL
jgi:hypothetical protein